MTRHLQRHLQVLMFWFPSKYFSNSNPKTKHPKLHLFKTKTKLIFINSFTAGHSFKRRLDTVLFALSQNISFLDYRNNKTVERNLRLLSFIRKRMIAFLVFCKPVVQHWQNYCHLLGRGLKFTHKVLKTLVGRPGEEKPDDVPFPKDVFRHRWQ